MERDVKDMKTSVGRMESALIGQWNEDGSYRDGWIQSSQRVNKMFVWLGVLLTSILTGLLVFAAENWFTLHYATKVAPPH